jgi:hypothetical protein
MISVPVSAGPFQMDQGQHPNAHAANKIDGILVSIKREPESRSRALVWRRHAPLFLFRNI